MELDDNTVIKLAAATGKTYDDALYAIAMLIRPSQIETMPGEQPGTFVHRVNVQSLLPATIGMSWSVQIGPRGLVHPASFAGRLRRAWRR